jgi:hypothetical protein
VEDLQQAMGVDEKGIHQHTSRLLVWKETGMSIA